MLFLCKILSCSLSSHSTSSSEKHTCLSLLTLLTDLISQSFDYFRWLSLNSTFMVPVEENCLNTVLLRSCELGCCLACGIPGSACLCTFLEKESRGIFPINIYHKNYKKPSPIQGDADMQNPHQSQQLLF